MDKNGAAVNSVIAVNPDAVSIADDLDKERRAQKPRGPLHGIPVLIKDNIDTSDRMPTTAGSLALVGSKPVKDSFVAQRLRKSGAVILGKTNLSEWAAICVLATPSADGADAVDLQKTLTLSTATLARIKLRFRCRHCGQPGAPGGGHRDRRLDRLPFLRYVDWSALSRPSACSAVRELFPIAHSQDTPGPMARTVRDAAILLSALCGVDPGDKATAASAGKAAADYRKFSIRGLRGPALAWHENILDSAILSTN